VSFGGGGFWWVPCPAGKNWASTPRRRLVGRGTVERRWAGAHYTTERDILKLVRSLFLDDLRAEFDHIAGTKGTQRDSRLREFHAKLGMLKFLHPACGCGNFLVVTYRELRLLEIDLLVALQGKQTQLSMDVATLFKIDVDCMFGIEISEFPAQIAQVALWLIDHQMNIRLSTAFGQRTSARIWSKGRTRSS